jgi:hypothetical protein
MLVTVIMTRPRIRSRSVRLVSRSAGTPGPSEAANALLSIVGAWTPMNYDM